MHKQASRVCGSGGIWTHASRETGALIQRLRPLGHTTCLDRVSLIPNGLSLQAPCIPEALGTEFASSVNNAL